MSKITINEKEYETDDMSEEARAQLVSLQFVDNDAARWAIVRVAIRSDSGSDITDMYWKLEIDLKSNSWTDRVRSAPNVGDAASRLERQQLKDLGYEESPFPSRWESAAAWDIS